jgi:anthranilate phosphoribosyltransferase
MTFAEAIRKLSDKKSLTRQEASEAMEHITQGRATAVQIAAFLTALRMKGETIDEIAGSAEALLAVALPVRRDKTLVVDTCGTGGDGQGSFNISTTTAFVVAGAGFRVAKHGNRSVSSKSGSSDVLQALGMTVETTAELAETCLRDIGLTFLFAPSFHPATQAAAPVRRELGIRTIFNVLGPLTNPAKPEVQLIGVFDAAWVRLLAEVQVALGHSEGLVVHGDGHDEIVLSGPTTVAEITGGKIQMHQWQPADFGLLPHKAASLRGGNAEENAKILMQVLEGRPGVFREAVGVNAAALIRSAVRLSEKKTLTLPEAYARAMESIDSKNALKKFEALRKALKGTVLPS